MEGVSTTGAEIDSTGVDSTGAAAALVPDCQYFLEIPYDLPLGATSAAALVPDCQYFLEIPYDLPLGATATGATEATGGAVVTGVEATGAVVASTTATGSSDIVGDVGPAGTEEFGPGPLRACEDEKKQRLQCGSVRADRCQVI